MHVSKDLAAGGLFFLIGLGMVVVAFDYRMGTLLRMGPGFFPVMVGGLMALTGIAIAAKALVVGGGAAPRLALRPFVVLLAAIVVFALTLETLGLVLSTVLLTLTSRLAISPVHWKGALLLSAALVLVAVLIFDLLLELPLTLWP